jgi:hypothetical protein
MSGAPTFNASQNPMLSGFNSSMSGSGNMGFNDGRQPRRHDE